MFQQLVEFLDSIPFFSSLTFGIIAMVIVGSSWCLVGLVMGDAPKKGIEPSLVQFGGAIVSTMIGTTIMVTTSAYSTAEMLPTILTCSAYFVGSCLNFVMLQFMSKAMQLGPNGIIWAIIQSALVFPFIVGILGFDVQFTILRGIGIIALLSALILFAFTKNNEVKNGNKKWKLYAFFCLSICATQQNLTMMPSYFEEARGVSSILRSVSAASGLLIMSIIWNLVQMTRERWVQIKSNIRNKTLWKYIGALQFFGLIFSYTLFYPGLNVMASKGMGGMCYPMMVGSCIVSFTLSSVWLLKEKMRPLQLAALFVCICGLILICTKA